MIQHISEDRLRAVCIYPAPMGGWHADVVFKNMPPGVPDTVGTSVGSPKPTREKALETGRDLLHLALATARQNATGPHYPKPPPAFILHGSVFILKPEILAKYAAQKPAPVPGFDPRTFALHLIASILDDFCPQGFNGDVFNAWPAPKKALLLGAIHLAALAGVTRFPPPEVASPSARKESSAAVH